MPPIALLRKAIEMKPDVRKMGRPKRSPEENAATREKKILEEVTRFDTLPNSAGIKVGVVAVLTNTAEQSVWKWIAAGKLRAFRLGDSTRVHVGSLRAMMNGEKVAV
jgi:hypothetical protein